MFPAPCIGMVGFFFAFSSLLSVHFRAVVVDNKHKLMTIDAEPNGRKTPQENVHTHEARTAETTIHDELSATN